MNVKRFIGRNGRDAMQQVKASLGDEAIVLSTKTAADGGVEILAMAGDQLAAVESMAPAAAQTSPTKSVAARRQAQDSEASAPAPSRGGLAGLAHSVQEDVKQLTLSTLSFQDYVRERMLRRRQAAMQERTEPSLSQATPEDSLNQRFASARAVAPVGLSSDVDLGLGTPVAAAQALTIERVQVPASSAASAPSPYSSPMSHRAGSPAGPQAEAARAPAQASRAAASKPVKETKEPKEASAPQVAASRSGDPATMQALKAAQDANTVMLGELRAMRAMVAERFETMAFLDKLGRTPTQAHVAQRLLDGGFSTVLIRKLLAAMPPEVQDGRVDEMGWVAQVLQRNLNAAEQERAIEDETGAFALIGSTGVGKTTTTAKLAATFAAKHGASNLGLITLDAYRVGAHEQLRGYGRILGVPVHTAHDRAALDDLLDLLSGKRLILIDTAGMAQRDSRTRELLDMLTQPRVRRLLVINAASQGDSIEDVIQSYHAQHCVGAILSKLDEAVKLGPALDALIRHKLKVMGVANGQRVPEDWHRLSSQALVHRAMRASLNPAYRLDPNEVSLLMAAPAAMAPVSPVPQPARAL